MSARSGIDRPWLQLPGPAAAEKVAALAAVRLMSHCLTATNRLIFRHSQPELRP